MIEQTESQNIGSSLIGDLFCDLSSNDVTNFLLFTTSISNGTVDRSSIHYVYPLSCPMQNYIIPLLNIVDVAHKRLAALCFFFIFFCFLYLHNLVTIFKTLLLPLQFPKPFAIVFSLEDEGSSSTK